MYFISISYRYLRPRIDGIADKTHQKYSSLLASQEIWTYGLTYHQSYKYVHHAAQYSSTFRVAPTQAVRYDLSRGLPSYILFRFDYVRLTFVQYACILAM